MAFLNNFVRRRPPLPTPPRANRGWLATFGRAGGWFVALGLGLGLHVTAVSGAETTVAREYLIKAAFLYNFTKFVEWPAERFADATSPIVIGVVGRNPFDAELANIVKGRTANGRAIVVKSITTANEVRAVHLLFLPGGEETHLPAAAWRNVGVVTVGESAGFRALGGTITFTEEGDKVRFEINLATAERDGLKISAQLLKLAASVHRKS